jgi:hypothetical protein
MDGNEAAFAPGDAACADCRIEQVVMHAHGPFLHLPIAPTHPICAGLQGSPA